MVIGQKKTCVQFNEIISSENELRRIAGQPVYWFQAKVRTWIDRRCREFISKSPFVVVASTGLEGNVDTSPKGDEPGFVRVLDEVTLAFPDRSGNRRFETFQNLLHNPVVGLIFFVPGRRDTLRVGGKAMIVRDLALRETMASKGRIPELATVVSVERAYFHCGSCIARSRLWETSEGARRTADEQLERART